MISKVAKVYLPVDDQSDVLPSGPTGWGSRPFRTLPLATSGGSR